MAFRLFKRKEIRIEDLPPVQLAPLSSQKQPLPQEPVPPPPEERVPITFGQPEKYGESYRRATGVSSFSIAIPIRRESGKLRVRDFNFLYKNGALVKITPTGTALLAEEHFRAADLRRRKRHPDFTFGSTVKPQIDNPDNARVVGMGLSIGDTLAGWPVSPFALFKKKEVRIEDLPPVQLAPPSILEPPVTLAPTPAPTPPTRDIPGRGFGDGILQSIPPEFGGVQTMLPQPEVPEIEEPTFPGRVKEAITEVGKFITPGVELIKEQPITVFGGPTIGEVITPAAGFVEKFRERFITEPYKEMEEEVLKFLPGPTVVPEQKIPLYTGETGIIDPFTGEVTTPRQITIPEHERLGLGPTLAKGVIRGARLFGEIGIETAALPVTLPGAAFAGVEAQEKVEETLKDIKEETYQAHIKTEVPEGFRHYTSEEFDVFWQKELAPQVREDVIRQAQFQVGVAGVTAGALVGLGAGVRAARAFQPKVITRVGKPIQWTKEVQVVQPTGKGLGIFEVYGYRPPTEAMVTTPFREAFKLKPKVPWTPITRPTLDVFRPVAGKPIPLGAPYIGELAKVPRVPYGLTTGELEAFARVTPRRTIKIIEVRGVGRPITPEAVIKLPAAERYVWTGRPGILVTTETERLAEARLRTAYLGKIKRPTKRELVIKPFEFFGIPGKQTQQFYLATKAKPTVEIGPVRFFKTELAAKEVTFPFYRAAGKIPRIPGELVQIPAEALPPGRIVTELLPAPKLPGPPTFALAKPGKPFEWLKQVPAAKVIPRPIPKPIIPKPKPVTVPKEVARERLGVGKPLMVGGLGITVPGVAVAFDIKPAFTPPVIEQQFIQVPRVDVIPREVVDVIPRVITIPRLVERAITIPRVIPRLIPGERLIPRVRERLVPRVGLAPRLVPRIRVTPPTVRPVRVTPTKIRPKVSRLEIGVPRKDKKKRKRRLGEQFFIPEIRRYGRFIPVAKPLPRKKALQVGVGKLRRTLGAALRLRRPGTKEFARIARETREFRPGKKGKDLFVLVQKAPYRLGTRAEVAEIILARRGVKFFK